MLRSFSRSTLRAQNNLVMIVGLTKGLVTRAYTVPVFEPADVRTHDETQGKAAIMACTRTNRGGGWGIAHEMNLGIRDQRMDETA